MQSPDFHSNIPPLVHKCDYSHIPKDNRLAFFWTFEFTSLSLDIDREGLLAIRMDEVIDDKNTNNDGKELFDASF